MRNCGIGNRGGSIYKWFHMSDAKGGPRCSIIPSALESGTQTIDNKIIEPEEVVVEGYVHENDYASLGIVDEAVEGHSLDNLMSIVTRDAVYTNQMPVKLETHSVKDNWEYVIATIHFKEVFFDDNDPAGDNSVTR